MAFQVLSSRERNLKFKWEVEEEPGVREHVKNIIFRFRGVNIIIWGSKSSILLPKPLPLGLNFMERIRPLHRLLVRLLLLHFIRSSSHWVPNTSVIIQASIAQSKTKWTIFGRWNNGISRTNPLRGEGKCERAKWRWLKLKQLKLSMSEHELGVHLAWEEERVGISEDEEWPRTEDNVKKMALK